MPIYEIQTPDGQTFEIDSPTPPTPEDLSQITGTPPNTGESFDMGTAALGAVGLAGLGLLAKNRGMMGSGLTKLNNLRQQLMLTGFAMPKSLLGNVGAATAYAAETRSMEPLKQMFSRATLADAAAAYKANAGVGPTAGGAFPGPNPGRIMGAFDVASRNALQRASPEALASGYNPMTARAAEEAVFQAPLGRNYGPFSETLDSPVAQFVFPFRRTPYNQFAEGLKTLKTDFPYHGVRNVYTGVGAAHGALTADEQYPTTIPLAAAGAAKYGLPYAGGALIGRTLAGGSGGGGAVSSALPVSEWGVEQSLQEPWTTFTEPPAFSALRRLGF